MMISKNRLKELCTYKQQKHCVEAHLYVVEGPKMAHEALLTHAPIQIICATQQWLALNASIVPSGVQSHEVTETDLARLSHETTPNQVWMLVQRPVPTEPATEGLILALDNLQNPGNLGTIIRIADWFGIRHIVCSHDTADCYNPKVVQATMGAIFRTEVHYTDLPLFLSRCPLPIYGAALDGEDIRTTTLPLYAVIVIGNESHGINPHVAPYLTRRILIPNIGHTCESLNAAVAAGILCYEFTRQQ